MKHEERGRSKKKKRRMDWVDTREERGGHVCARAGKAKEGKIDEKWFKCLGRKGPDEAKRGQTR